MTARVSLSRASSVPWELPQSPVPRLIGACDASGLDYDDRVDVAALCTSGARAMSDDQTQRSAGMRCFWH